MWWRQEATEKNFGPPWKTRRELKGGGGEVGRWARSRTVTGRERKSGRVIGMLVRRRSTPGWANELVWQSEMMERIQVTPRWLDEPLWWI